jgi:hypothetical protein
VPHWLPGGPRCLTVHEPHDATPQVVHLCIIEAQPVRGG